MSWYPPGRSSRSLTLMHGSDWNPSGGILHIVPNELNQVVDGHTTLASRLGVLARDGNLTPFTYRTWSHVLKENKERIWREVKETNKKNEVPATRLEVWMAGYSKDNKPSTDKVAKVMELGAQSNATDEDIMTQVLGLERPGRIRTYGLGHSLTDVFGG